MSLGKGKGQAIKGKILAYQCGYDADGSDRMTRKMIGLLIEEGYPIASNTGKNPGFFIAESKEEVITYNRQLMSRIREEAIRLKCFKRAARIITNPEQLAMELKE